MSRILTTAARGGLFLIALPPVLIGGFALVSMATGSLNGVSDVADVARRASYPVAMVLHIVGGSAMVILGLLQFSGSLRARAPGFHRWAGRVLLALGAGVSLSALWMNASPLALPESQLHNGAQNIMAAIFLIVASLGLAAARARDFAAHRAWMLRAYAICMGAGTQTLMLFPVFVVYGKVEGLAADLAFIGAWVLNLAVAEAVIGGFGRRQPAAA